MNCDLCGKKLASKEATLCKSCLAFIEYKYGTLENYQKERYKALGGDYNE